MRRSSDKNKEKLSQDPLASMTLKADRFMLITLWAHLPFVSFVASADYATWKIGLVSSLIISILGSISYVFCKGSFANRLFNGQLLIAYSIVLIAVQFGRIEMHFHVFIALLFLLIYKDWKIIPPAAILIIIHHALFDFFQFNKMEFMNFPLIVFNYGHSWEVTLDHSVFIIFQCCVLIYYSKMLKEQFIKVHQAHSNLESIILRRTASLRKEMEKVEAYNNALDQVAITVVTDEQGKILDLNDKFEKISQYSRRELIGATHRLVNSNYHPKKFFEESWNTIKSGKPWRGEIKNRSKNGAYYWLESAIVPIKNSHHEIQQFMAISFDISDRKKNESVIKNQQEQIVSQSKLLALGEMAGGIAHEINNPLAVISSSMSSIRKMIDKNMTDSQLFNEALNNIDLTTLRINKIITGLRNISRDASAEDFEDCVINDLLSDVLALCVDKFKAAGIDLQIMASHEVLTQKIPIMRVQLSQVILNLLINACDEVAVLEKKWIHLYVENEKGQINFKVIDAGSGVPKDIQDKIFQPFFTTKDIGKGTGLGLSLSHSIMQKHNGDLYIDKNHSNTCFVVSIPDVQPMVLH